MGVMKKRIQLENNRTCRDASRTTAVSKSIEESVVAKVATMNAKEMALQKARLPKRHADFLNSLVILGLSRTSNFRTRVNRTPAMK